MLHVEFRPPYLLFMATTFFRSYRSSYWIYCSQGPIVLGSMGHLYRILFFQRCPAYDPSFKNGLAAAELLYKSPTHYSDVIISVMVSQITAVTIVYSTICSGAHQSSASLAFVRGIHRSPVNSPYKGPVTRKIFPFGDVIMYCKRFRAGWFARALVIR